MSQTQRDEMEKAERLQHEAEANLAHARVKIEATADGTVGQGNDPAAAAARSRVLSDPHDLLMQQPERFIGSDVSISLESRATVTAVTDHYVVVRLHPESGPDYIRIDDFCFCHGMKTRRMMELPLRLWMLLQCLKPSSQSWSAKCARLSQGVSKAHTLASDCVPWKTCLRHPRRYRT